MFRFFTFATIAILLYVPVLLLAQEKNALPQSVHFPIDKSFVIYDYPENESTFSDIHAQIINVIKGKQKKSTRLILPDSVRPRETIHVTQSLPLNVLKKWNVMYTHSFLM